MNIQDRGDYAYVTEHGNKSKILAEELTTEDHVWKTEHRRQGPGHYALESERRSLITSN